ncbi:Acetyltransferase (GNAT) family protein [Chryseobacterium taichungense]|uniref:Acetyltransferase (GNAT) family protein n=1 Tax=Chryseobacterium taichungense TaxID=295069 RepID=A0A1H7YCL7_9FLAO|nr:GNAT family N-acetyltransferase [Chryseobacterium taichungense]SEM42919.1 Acetyltransferase (GNAT) family protein [Chryseobacterium taichungense]
MRKATKNDIPRLIEILTESFQEDKSANYVLKSKKSLPKLFHYSIAKGFLFGDVWIKKDLTACAVLIDPKKKSFNLKSIWLDLQYQVFGLIKIKKLLNKENIIAEVHPKDLDYIHLWFLGVMPEVQHQGKGSVFLTDLTEYYKTFKEAMCVETSTLVNIPFFEKRGFSWYATKYFGFEVLFYKKLL